MTDEELKRWFEQTQNKLYELTKSIGEPVGELLGSAEYKIRFGNNDRLAHDSVIIDLYNWCILQGFPFEFTSKIWPSWSWYTLPTTWKLVSDSAGGLDSEVKRIVRTKMYKRVDEHLEKLIENRQLHVADMS